jgi:hypothetical protein
MSQRLGQQYDRYNGNTNYRAFNQYDMETRKYNTLNNNNNNQLGLSVKNESDIEYSKRIEYITVSSRDRDISNYPSPSHYSVKLPFELRNIYSIEILNGIIPDKNNVTREPYLLLKVEELNYHIMSSNDKNMTDSFAILHMAPPITPGYFLNVDKKTFEHTVLRFETPKANLSKLTISITDCDGNLFNFGDDSGGPNKSLQNTFIFRVVVLEKNRNILQHRNVF